MLYTVYTIFSQISSTEYYFLNNHVIDIHICDDVNGVLLTIVHHHAKIN